MRSVLLTIVLCTVVLSVKSQTGALTVSNVSKYHFKITNTASTSIDVYIGQDAGTTGLRKSFTLSAGNSRILLKSRYRRGTVIQSLNKGSEPIFLWDYIDNGGAKLTPRFDLSFGGPGYKSSLSDGWKGTGNNFQYAFHFSYSPLPEIRIAKKTFSRIYFSFDHELYSHLLDVDDDAFLTGDYVKSSDQPLYRLTNHEDVSLNLKYYSVGAYHRLYFLPTVFFDLGVRLPLISNSFVDFRNDDNEVQNRFISPGGEPTDPKIRDKVTFGDGPLDDLIFFTKFGFYTKNTDPYSPVPEELYIAISFQLFTSNITPNADFPVVFDDPGTPEQDFVPVPTNRQDNLYYMAMVHIGIPIGAK